MNELDRKMTKDDTTLINAVCGGMPFDFTSQFMARIPAVLEAYNDIGWVHDLVPDVPDNDYKGFNAVIVGEDGKKHVVACMAYLNRYELNLENPEHYIDQGYDIDVVKDKWDDIACFYTGWAFQCYDSYEEQTTFDFLETGRLIAWRELPTYRGVNHG